MSILLDAVTRSSQQPSGVLVDPVLTPRVHYQAQTSALPLKNLSLLCLAIGLGVGAAWMLGKGNPPAQIARLEVVETAGVDAKEAGREALRPVLSGRPQTQEASVSTRANPVSAIAAIQPAGKVALPLAQAYVPSHTQAELTQVAEFADEDFNDDDAHDEAAFIDSVGYGRHLETAQEDTAADEPIILGANANSLGLEKLAALKQQQRTEMVKPSRDNDALVAAFQAALKEVEVSNAVAKPVSAPELDPIVQPKQDRLPKYGQLPAALQLQVPEFNVNAHVYASEPAKRWLNVDGIELQQGDKIKGKLTIVEIRPRDIVLSIEGTEFKVPAI
jgi:general secretion pathway protein B